MSLDTYIHLVTNTICFTSAAELAHRIRTSDLSPVTVVDAFLERINERNPIINAYTTVIAEEARKAAASAEQMLENGKLVGPLHGVPVAIKDFGAFKKGVRHTFGSRAFTDFVPESDALFVERLEDAGAIVLGKTNTPEFARGGVTRNPLFGTTVNPFDFEKTASGSSGGSAAAVADGLAPLAQGSDVGGSIRAPASACGVYGFKPSFGRIPKTFKPNRFVGHTPYNDIGSLSRTVEDAALMLDVMAGPHPRDPWSLPDDGTAYNAAIHQPTNNLEIAYSDDLDLFPVDERVRTALEDALDQFKSMAAAVDPVNLNIGHDLEAVHNQFLIMIQAFSAEYDRCFEDAFGIEVLGEHQHQVTDYVVERSKAARELSALEYTHADAMRTKVFDAIQDVFERYDLLIAPTLSVPPFGVNESGPEKVDGTEIDGSHGWMMTWLFNMTGHPVASIPIGFTSDGLPIGAQLVGQRFADDTVLSASAAFERVSPWSDAYPPGK